MFEPTCESIRLNVPLAKCSITKNAAGESQVKMLESVREYDVYILNTGCGEINTSCVLFSSSTKFNYSLLTPFGSCDMDVLFVQLLVLWSFSSLSTPARLPPPDE